MPKVVRIQSRICVGGPALHTILLAEGLSARMGSRYETHLIGGALEPGEASMEPFAKARGVDMQIFPEMRRSPNPKNDALALAKLTQALRKLRPEIVHTHTAKAGALGRVAARAAGVPKVVHTFHGHVFDGYFSSRKARAFVQVERQLARLSDRIVAISSSQKDDLVHRYKIAPEHKVDVVPLGLDLVRFRQLNGPSDSLRKELGLAPGTPIVLSVGRLVHIKRFDLLLESFKLALKDVPDAHLVIVGDGEATFREAMERVARHISPNIHFLGWRNDLANLYAGATVFALSSDNEGTPVAVMEALTAGLPVVATDVGGLADFVTDEMGSLVPRGEFRPLAAALVDALRFPRRVGDAARDQIFRRFSQERLVRDISALYDELLGTPRSRPSLIPLRIRRERAAC